MGTYQNKETQEKRFIKIIEKTKIYNQEQFVEEYRKYYGNLSQSTVSTYFPLFNITKGKDGAYFQDDSDEISDLISETCYGVDKCSSSLIQIIVHCDTDREIEICKALKEKFPKISSIIPAYGSVVILWNKKYNSKNIFNYLRRYRTKRYTDED